MSLVVTLIAAGPQPGLDPAVIDAVRKALSGLGVRPSAPVWLAPDAACDLALDGLATDQADAAARHALADAPVDVIVQPAAGRRKRLLIADMESTIIRQEMLDELGDLVGLRDRIADITARAMNGEIDFIAAVHERVALLRGLPATVLDDLAARIEPMPGAGALVATMRAHGGVCVLVSGGFRSFTRVVRDRLGFDADHGNDLEIADGRLTGRPVEPILDRESKLRLLIETAAAHHTPLADCLAVGDGANDLPMLKAAGLGIAFRAKTSVRTQATHRIDYADLTALLYAQGYRQHEILQP